MQIVNLSCIPAHLPVIAAWIHDAFWQDSSQQVAFIEGLLADHLADTPIPTTFVAVEDGVPVGSVCLIESDMAERPAFTPWLAALYVRPANRKRGIGSRLVNVLVDHATKARYETIYLSADEQVALYARHGFTIIETDVGSRRLTIMRHKLTKGKQS